MKFIHFILRLGHATGYHWIFVGESFVRKRRHRLFISRILPSGLAKMLCCRAFEHMFACVCVLVKYSSQSYVSVQRMSRFDSLLQFLFDVLLISLLLWPRSNLQRCWIGSDFIRVGFSTQQTPNLPDNRACFLIGLAFLAELDNRHSNITERNRCYCARERKYQYV